MFDIGNAFLNIRYAIYGLIRAALASVLDLFGSMTDGLINASLRTENALQTGAISTDMIERIYYYIYGAAVTLVVLKFLWKGVQIYILWRDGDSENSPQSMIIGACMSLVVCLAFPALYNIAVDFTVSMGDEITGIIGGEWLSAGDAVLGSAAVHVDTDEVYGESIEIFDRMFQYADIDGDGTISYSEAADYIETKDADPFSYAFYTFYNYFSQTLKSSSRTDWPVIVQEIFSDRESAIETIYSIELEWAREDAIEEETGSFDYYVALGRAWGETNLTLIAVATIVYVIIYAILYVKLLARGIEMLFLRCGLPIASIGLIDSDSGVFKSYTQIMLRQMATSIIQVVAMYLSLYVLMDGAVVNLIMGIAIALAGWRGPQLMAQILAPQKQGGGMAYKGMMLIQAARLLA